jgi:hypothetical protein
MGRNEMDFSYEGVLTFEDLETGRTLPVEADQARQSYLQRLQKKLRELKQALHNEKISYTLFRLDQPLDLALRQYLMQRTKLL